MKIYVGNLAWTMHDDDLTNMFERYGTVSSATIVRVAETGRSRGFGFVEMPDDGEGNTAIGFLHDAEVMGRKLVVTEAQNPDPDSQPRGGGGFKKPRFSGSGGDA